jgi:hypothetical protein
MDIQSRKKEIRFFEGSVVISILFCIFPIEKMGIKQENIHYEFFGPAHN